MARACLQREARLAVQAKREIGKLWDDIERPPYRVLFNEGLTGPDLWRMVQVLREVDRSLQDHQSTVAGRERLLCVHGTRFISHLVFSMIGDDILGHGGNLTPGHSEIIHDTTMKVFSEVLSGVNNLYPEGYLGSLFKNATKCQEVKEEVLKVV